LAPDMLEHRFPTWDTCTPTGTFAYPKGYGTFEVGNRREIYSYTSFISKNVFIYQ